MAITLCSVQDVLDLAGFGMNAYAGSSLLVQRFINRAEGVIASETRRDWINGFSSTTSENREILKECCASKAGIDLASYDGRGFFSRTEQETKLDVLQDIFSRSLKALKDLDTTRIRAVGD
jgi:hypothetical protein